MSINFDLVPLLDLLALVQGVLLGVLLMLKKKEHVSYLLLGLFLFMYSSELLTSILIDTGVFFEKPELLYLPVNFNLGFMPALFLYVKSLSGPINWKRYAWLFLPVLLEFLLFMVFFLQSTEVKYHQLTEGIAPSYFSIYVNIAISYSIVYAILILLDIRRHRHKMEGIYSNLHGKRLDWINWVCIFIIVVNLIWLSGIFISQPFFEQYIYSTTSAANVAFIFWVALSGFKQEIITLPKSEATALDNNSLTSEIETLQKDDNKDQQEFQRILTHLETHKTFTQPDLLIAELARDLQLSQRRLSELLNQQAGANFNQFINQLRVEEAKRLLTDEKYAYLNILGIGFEVGFNSKTAFYTAFKKVTGMTPAKFQKQKHIAGS